VVVAGSKLGNYELLAEIARGSTTDVLLARARGMAGFERHVVIKRVREERAGDSAFTDAFITEARLAATLHHHNIVQVQDIAEANGVPYFAMEYVHGEDLRVLLAHVHARRESIPIAHILTIGLAVAAALHQAHEHGIVHRDVTPANILVGYDGNVKVLDFGMAKAAITPGTQVGIKKGKAPYMAPEQCTGEKVDRRSDVFALGIVLYELLTARRLFKGASDHDTMSTIVHGTIPSPRAHRADLAPELASIIMKALARLPNDRYQSTADLALALEAYSGASGVVGSSSALGAYLRQQLGERKEPWLADGSVRPTAPVDFDGKEAGIAVPAGETTDTKSRPAARARTDTPVKGSPTPAVEPEPVTVVSGGAGAAALAAAAAAAAAPDDDDDEMAEETATMEMPTEQLADELLSIGLAPRASTATDIDLPAAPKPPPSATAKSSGALAPGAFSSKGPVAAPAPKATFGTAAPSAVAAKSAATPTAVAAKTAHAPSLDSAKTEPTPVVAQVASAAPVIAKPTPGPSAGAGKPAPAPAPSGVAAKAAPAAAAVAAKSAPAAAVAAGHAHAASAVGAKTAPAAPAVAVTTSPTASAVAATSSPAASAAAKPLPAPSAVGAKSSPAASAVAAKPLPAPFAAKPEPEAPAVASAQAPAGAKSEDASASAAAETPNWDGQSTNVPRLPPPPRVAPRVSTPQSMPKLEAAAAALDGKLAGAAVDPRPPDPTRRARRGSTAPITSDASDQARGEIVIETQNAGVDMTDLVHPLPLEDLTVDTKAGPARKQRRILIAAIGCAAVFVVIAVAIAFSGGSPGGSSSASSASSASAGDKPSMPAPSAAAAADPGPALASGEMTWNGVLDAGAAGPAANIDAAAAAAAVAATPEPPVAAPAPPVEAPAPPVEVPAPPVEVPAPPVEAPAPPVEVSAPPVEPELPAKKVVKPTPKTIAKAAPASKPAPETKPAAATKSAPAAKPAPTPKAKPSTKPAKPAKPAPLKYDPNSLFLSK